MSQILTVESALPETRMLSLSSMPLVRDWCPVSVWMQFPVSTSQTLIDVSNEPLTTWIPSNWRKRINLNWLKIKLSSQLVGDDTCFRLINKPKIKLVEMNEFY